MNRLVLVALCVSATLGCSANAPIHDHGIEWVGMP